MDYRVDLDIYNGPLDLLLYLIKRDELDIYDIPISHITESYMSYLNMLKDSSFDINLAGDFLVMAATLMEIKSATLLPKPPPQPGQESSAAADLTDPRYDLVQKLLEYKRFKDSAFALERQQHTFAARFPRIPARIEGDTDEDPPVDLDEVQIWDLFSAFNQLMKEVGVRKPSAHEVVYDDTPIDLHAADIEDRLRREKVISFKQLLVGRQSRSEMIGVFLALLELIREKKIVVRPVAAEGEILADNAHDFELLPAPPKQPESENAEVSSEPENDHLVKD